jgi:hypothetical protein
MAHDPTRRDGRAADCTGLENRCGSSIPDASSSISATSSADPAEERPDDLASCLALLTRKSPDLALLVERWDGLPEAIRAGIAAMIRAAGSTLKNRP